MKTNRLKQLWWDALEYVEGRLRRVYSIGFVIGFTLFEFARGGLKWDQVKRILSGKKKLIISYRYGGSDKRGHEQWW